jgi:CRISPR/Cas system-associated exonuclease Cas4 (RecB family)
MAVLSWSHSKLADFDKCKRMFWLKHDQKIPEPPRPLPPGKTEHANDRGTRVHENCELYVKGEIDDLAFEADKHFGWQLDLLRVLYAEQRVSLEGEWGHDVDWEVAEWKKAWLRLKLDICVHIDDTHAIVIDLKTGRKFGNEIKHAEQLQLYQLCTFLRFPKLEKVTAELWYLDQNEVTTQTFTRSQGLRFRQGFDKRGIAATSCEVFPPNPNRFSCRWCPYLNTEHCTVGVAN